MGAPELQLMKGVRFQMFSGSPLEARPHFCDTRESLLFMGVSLWEALFVVSQAVISHNPVYQHGAGYNVTSPFERKGMHRTSPTKCFPGMRLQFKNFPAARARAEQISIFLFPQAFRSAIYRRFCEDMAGSTFMHGRGGFIQPSSGMIQKFGIWGRTSVGARFESRAMDDLGSLGSPRGWLLSQSLGMATSGPRKRCIPEPRVKGKWGNHPPTKPMEAYRQNACPFSMDTPWA